MAKVLRCQDIGVDCDWEGRAETEEELFQLVAEHGCTMRGITEIPAELMEQARALIREE